MNILFWSLWSVQGVLLVMLAREWYRRWINPGTANEKRKAQEPTPEANK
jgi:hypothetical protein